ncbi:MAG: FAD-dependent oxidoreductase [Firmicutes bacterium]|nr:FAD-dependent oxidoreductase [Bacillota bacterium]
MNKETTDILIIGGGPAGLTAGVYSARGGKKTIIIEEQMCGGQLIVTQDIENMPGYTFTTGAELAMEMQKSAITSGAKIVYERINSVDFKTNEDGSPSLHKVITTETEYTAKAIIIATGAGARKLNVKNNELYEAKGIHYCAHCDGSFYKDKHVIVVGTGNSAVEEALYLANIAKHVTVIAKYEKFTAQAILVDKLTALDNIRIYFKHGVVCVDGNSKLASITIAPLEQPQQDPLAVDVSRHITINCDGIFVAIGREPSSRLFKDIVELNKLGYIKVNDKMETNISGVYAAGDICEKQLRQIVTACSDGAIAALNAGIHTRKFK